MASPSEDRRNRDEIQTIKEMMHKTKKIQFFGRTTPIILQNDNGPCPLLAICNLLLLRNNLSLRSDIAEVSQEKLLFLVAERLIDSNSNIDNKDVGYLRNQLQNVSDAIDLLPRLTTGIDVNLKFMRINDFEFTRECAIFDLLDIPLYHGWIVDPQDFDTSNAIGSKSYNTLMAELVALETQNMGSVVRKNREEDDVGFGPSTSSIGVPSQSLSHHTATDEQIERQEIEEEIEPLRGYKMSKTVALSSANDINVVGTAGAKVHDPCHKKPSASDNSSLMNNGSDSSPLVNEVKKISISEEKPHESCPSEPNLVLGSSKGISQTMNESKSLISTSVGNEPVCISKTRRTTNEGSVDATRLKDETTSRQGELITKFLKNNASQLTVYGLFSLLDGLKERELCVFFRNNNFNTMFKFKGELYILATDQGYLNQPELVWEKLNEVNGDTVFVNSKFKKFKAESNEISLWSEENETGNTDDYLARHDNTAQGNTSVNSDLRLAMALQQQFNEQSQRVLPQSPTTTRSGLVVGPQDYLTRHDNTTQGNTSVNSDLRLAMALQQQFIEQSQRVLPQSPTTTRSGLVVGPQHDSRPRSSFASSRQEPKSSEDNCIVM